MGSIIED